MHNSLQNVQKTYKYTINICGPQIDAGRKRRGNSAACSPVGILRYMVRFPDYLSFFAMEMPVTFTLTSSTCRPVMDSTAPVTLS